MCTQKIQRWHKKIKTIVNHFEMCGLLLSHISNIRSSQSILASVPKKKKNSSNEGTDIEDAIEKIIG